MPANVRAEDADGGFAECRHAAWSEADRLLRAESRRHTYEGAVHSTLVMIVVEGAQEVIEFPNIKGSGPRGAGPPQGSGRNGRFRR